MTACTDIGANRNVSKEAKNKMTSKLNLKTLGIIAVSIMLVVFGQFFAVFIPSLIAIGTGQFSILTYATIQQNASWAMWVSPAVGLAVIAAVLVRSRCKFDVKLTKRQFVKLSAFFAVVVAFSMVASQPLVRATVTATSGFVLDIPISQFDYLIGAQSTTQFYVINGSNWDCLTQGVGSTVWAGYQNNLTKLEELSLAATTNGTVYLSGVKFAYGLTVPINVQVVENVGGLTRTFINPANTVGSTYTVTIDSTRSTYYLAQDSQGRICYETTDCGALLRSVISLSPAKIEVGAGNFVWNTKDSRTIEGTANRCVFTVENMTGLIFQGAGMGKTNINVPIDTSEVIYVGNNAYNLTFSDMSFYQPDTVTAGNIFGIRNDGASTLGLISNVLITRILTSNTAHDPVTFQQANAINVRVEDNVFLNCRRYGVSVSLSTTPYVKTSDIWISNNNITAKASNQYPAIWQHGTYYGCTDLHIIGNDISNFGAEGVQFQGVVNSSFVEGNRIYNCSKYTTTAPGITLDYTEHSVIANNIIFDCYQGIAEANSDYNTITGNDLTLNTVKSQVTGAHTVISGNNGLPNFRNRLAGVTPTIFGWGTNPSDLTKTTDCDFTTATTWGNKTVAAGAMIGQFIFDMGANYNIELRARVGMNVSAGYVAATWLYSYDNSNWFFAVGYNVTSVTSATETIVGTIPVYVNARYVMLYITTSAAATSMARLYEAQALDFDNNAYTLP